MSDSSNPPVAIEAAGLADFVAGALGREPAGQIAVAEFGDPLRVYLADIPEGRHGSARSSAFARAFIGDIAGMPATGRGQRDVALLIYARDGHGLKDVRPYNAVWLNLLIVCEQRGLNVVASQFIIPTQWWGLPSIGETGPGTPRAAAGRTADGGPTVGAEGGADVVADAVRAFARELEAGHEAAKRSLKPLLAAVLTGRRDVEDLTDQEVARLLLAVQNGDILHAASTYCEPEEVKRAAPLWSRVARLCVDPYRRMAAAPLTLLGIALLLDGDVPAAAGAAFLALEVKPGDEEAQVLLGLVFRAELEQVVRAPVSVAEALRAALREDREE
ncbi:DUF4192 family protein [Kitasatospora sp. NPDC058046]|uniref:DUF4192 family protein n=1 Tax=Kitasatospora sp. NPDC058046 TaxID=3346312 RepID=UPI0036D84823